MASSRRSDLPPALRLAAALVAVEGICLLGLGVNQALAPLTFGVASVAGDELLAAFALLAGAALLWLAWGLARVRRWARGPTLLLQLLGVPVGATMVQAGFLVGGVPVLALVVVVLVSLFAPSARRPFELPPTPG